MRVIKVKTYKSKEKLNKKKQLAWKIAEVATDNVSLNKNSIEMAINRIIDNAAVATAALNRKPVISARHMALRHPRKKGATLFGVNSKLRFRKNFVWCQRLNTRAIFLIKKIIKVVDKPI